MRIINRYLLVWCVILCYLYYMNKEQLNHTEMTATDYLKPNDMKKIKIKDGETRSLGLSVNEDSRELVAILFRQIGNIELDEIRAGLVRSIIYELLDRTL